MDDAAKTGADGRELKVSAFDKGTGTWYNKEAGRDDAFCTASPLESVGAAIQSALDGGSVTICRFLLLRERQQERGSSETEASAQT